MSQWQPIETAPKDGSEFVAAYGRQGFVKKLVSYNKLRDCWVSKGERLPGFERNATHWLALPPPLTTQPEIQKGNADLVPEATCTYCKGNGWFSSAVQWEDDYACPRCLGTGRVGA